MMEERNRHRIRIRGKGHLRKMLKRIGKVFVLPRMDARFRTNGEKKLKQ